MSRIKEYVPKTFAFDCEYEQQIWEDWWSNNQTDIFDEFFECFEYAMKHPEVDEIIYIIFEFKDVSLTATMIRDEIPQVLDKAMNYFTKTEEYEKCAYIRDAKKYYNID